MNRVTRDIRDEPPEFIMSLVKEERIPIPAGGQVVDEGQRRMLGMEMSW